MLLNWSQPKKPKHFIPHWKSKAVQCVQPADSSTQITHKPTKEVSVMGWLEAPDGGVLMVHQVKEHKRWALPGGKVKEGESLATALKREVSEETGLHVTRMSPLAIFDRYQKHNVSFLFRIEVRKWKDLAPKDPREISEVAFRKRVPSNATPTLRYFFKQVQAGRVWS